MTSRSKRPFITTVLANTFSASLMVKPWAALSTRSRSSPCTSRRNAPRTCTERMMRASVSSNSSNVGNWKSSTLTSFSSSGGKRSNGDRNTSVFSLRLSSRARSRSLRTICMASVGPSPIKFCNRNGWKSLNK